MSSNSVRRHPVGGYIDTDVEVLVPRASASLRASSRRVPVTHEDEQLISSLAGDDIPARRVRYVQDVRSEDIRRDASYSGHRYHPLVYVGLVMLAALSLVVVVWCLAFVVDAGAQSQYRSDHEGAIRTLHADVVVGHGSDSLLNPTHLIVLVLRGGVKIVEIPGSQDKNARMWVGPQLAETPGWQGDPSDVWLSLSVRDVNHDGLPDIVVYIEGPLTLSFQHAGVEWILYNSGDGFRSS